MSLKLETPLMAAFPAVWTAFEAVEEGARSYLGGVLKQSGTDSGVV
jgi:hypothetical protein